MDTILLTLPAVRGAIATLEPVRERMAAALQPVIQPTALAQGLGEAGVQ